MATFARLASGNWHVQVRRKGRSASDTFLRRRGWGRVGLVVGGAPSTMQ